MSDTRHKLEESKYFLARMRDNVSNPRYFSFNLSAFLSSSRSVTWVMNKEFSNYKEFHNWYENKQKQMDCDFKFFKEMRNVTVKERIIMPNKTVSVDIEEKLVICDSVNVKVIRNGKVISEHSSTPSTTQTETSSNNEERKENKIFWFFKEHPDKSLLQFCEEHIEKLTILVNECEQAFK